MIVTCAVLLTAAVALAGVLLAFSPGVALPFLNETGGVLEGSISEKTHVTINGIRQGMFIKGKNKTNPVLLFLHGGPGMPEYAISREYPLILEEYFTVCWWEQRGAGLSYAASISPDDLTFEQLILDTLAATHYLRERFDQDKIYLMAHSAGTYVGLQVVAREPDHFSAYLPMAQITHQLSSEMLAYEHMVEEFTKRKNRRMLMELAKYRITEIDTREYYSMRDRPMHLLGVGTTREMTSVIRGVFLPVMLNREYTIGEKINIWRGKFLATTTADLWSKLLSDDLTMKVKRLEVPVFFFHGVHDYTASYVLAQCYFDSLEAPVKRFFSFEHSAHSPLFEEPDKMRLILRDILLPEIHNLVDTKSLCPIKTKL